MHSSQDFSPVGVRAEGRMILTDGKNKRLVITGPALGLDPGVVPVIPM
jgi:hypothetical protein